MEERYTIVVGTVGGGLSRTADGGETWDKIRNPIPSESNVRALSVYPDNPHRILAGTDLGIYRSDDNAATWEKLDSPMEDRQIWSVTVDPADSDIIFAGTRPDAFRSRDGGETWDELVMGLTIPCPVGVPRTTNMIVDPRDSRTVWAGIEVDGVYKSLDGGDNWVHLPDLGPDPFHGDIHGMAIQPGSTTSIYCTSPFGIATSTDEGESWDYHYFPKFNENDTLAGRLAGRDYVGSYCRGMAIKADNPNVMFVGNGDAIPGITGTIQRTSDGGKTWESTNLPVAPNSVVYWFGTHAAVPDVLAAGSLYGYVYLSTDGGDTWRKLKKEFGEIRSVAVMPN